MGAILTRLRKSEAGATMVEFALAAALVLILLGGIVDFLFAFWQWNSAMKAVEVGARIAAVSDPVAGGLMSTSTTLATGGKTGQPFPVDGFSPIVCDGAAQACCLGPASSCAAGSTAVSGITYDAAAMNWIVYGRNNSSCVNATTIYNIGMCQILSMLNPPLSPANVMIEYRMTGLGYQGGPPVPTITIWLKNVNYRYFFLGGLLNLVDIALPTPKTSITGEDISSSAPIN